MSGQLDDAISRASEQQKVPRNLNRPMNPNARRALSAYKDTKTKPPYFLRLIVHATNPAFETAWVLAPSIIVHLTQPQNYNQLNLDRIIDQQKEAIGVLAGIAAVPVFAAVTLKRFVRARSPLLSLTHRGGLPSTLCLALCCGGLLLPISGRPLWHKLGRNNTRLFEEMGVHPDRAAEVYARWVRGALEEGAG